jgi:hypothetical protein
VRADSPVGSATIESTFRERQRWQQDLCHPVAADGDGDQLERIQHQLWTTPIAESSADDPGGGTQLSLISSI